MNREQRKAKAIIHLKNKKMINESEKTSFNKYFSTKKIERSSIIKVYIRDLESAINRLQIKNKSKIKVKINDTDINKAFQNILEKNEQL